MKVEKIGDTLAVSKRLSDTELAELWASMDKFVRPFPPRYKFDREEANAR